MLPRLRIWKVKLVRSLSTRFKESRGTLILVLVLRRVRVGSGMTLRLGLARNPGVENRTKRRARWLKMPMR